MHDVKTGSGEDYILRSLVSTPALVVDSLGSYCAPASHFDLSSVT